MYYKLTEAHQSVWSLALLSFAELTFSAIYLMHFSTLMADMIISFILDFGCLFARYVFRLNLWQRSLLNIFIVGEWLLTMQWISVVVWFKHWQRLWMCLFWPLCNYKQLKGQPLCLLHFLKCIKHSNAHIFSSYWKWKCDLLYWKLGWQNQTFAGQNRIEWCISKTKTEDLHIMCKISL